MLDIKIVRNTSPPTHCAQLPTLWSVLNSLPIIDLYTRSLLVALSGISIIPLLVPAGSGNIVAKRENPAEIRRVGQSKYY